MQNTHSQKIQHVLLQHDKTRDLFYHSYMDTQNTATLGPLLSSGIILERTGLQNYQTITLAFGFQISLFMNSLEVASGTVNVRERLQILSIRIKAT